MNKLKLGLLSFIAIAVIGCEQTQDPETAGINYIIEANLRANVKFLSSDLLEGRGTGTQGLKIASSYVAAQFAKAGVEPGGENGTYFQEVPMVSYTAQNNGRFEFVKGRERLALKYLDDYVANTGKIEPRVQINSELVFVGYGVDAPEQNWSDYKDMDVTGKVLVMLVNDPPSEDVNHFGGKAMTYYGRWTYKYEEAGRKGAAGVILIHMTEKAGYGWNVISGWAGPQSSLKPKDGDPPKSSVEGWISREMATKLFEMSGNDFDDLVAKASSRDFQPVRLGVNLNVDLRSSIEDIVSQNTIGIVRGEIEDEYVVLTSHLDHLGVGIPVNGDNIYNGAVDNASGSSGMIEIAAAFASMPTKPKRTIIFLSVTAEEQGLLGSKYYSQNPIYPLNKTLANINYDSFTIFGEFETMTALGAERSSLGAIVEEVASINGLTVIPDTAPEKGYFFRSDQFSFAKAGIPALFIGNGDKYKGRDAAWGPQQHEKETNTTYHAPSDEYKESWNMDGHVQTARLAFQLSYRVANMDVWPVWNDGDAFKAARDAMLGNK